jgi:hypothetical protein
MGVKIIIAQRNRRRLNNDIKKPNVCWCVESRATCGDGFDDFSPHNSMEKIIFSHAAEETSIQGQSQKKNKEYLKTLRMLRLANENS